MSNMHILVLVAVALSALERVNAACPDTTSNPCFCTQQSYGLTISCRGYELASVKSLLGQISPAETVAEMVISDIPITDSLVPSDLFAGHQIDRVLLYCYAAYDVDAGLLRFSSDSFSSSDSGECTLTGTFFLQDCNLKQFDFHVFNACDRLTDIEMKWNNLNQVVNFPRMENLLRLKISTNYLWPSTSPFGLTSFDVSVESIPNLKELDLSFNSLQDDQVSFVSQMKNVEQIHLSNNQLSVVPDLTNLSSLQNFVMTLDVFQANLSIYLPNPVQSPVFQFDAYSTFDYVSLNQFKGDFSSTNFVGLSLSMPMKYLNESLFLEPLTNIQSGYISLSSASKFVCGCDLAWLIRDHPDLVAKTYGGYCSDGRYFKNLTPEDFSSCN